MLEVVKGSGPWRSLIVGGLVMTIVSGCAGRDPNMVASLQAGDRKLTCEDLEEEYGYNHAMAARKIIANKSDDEKDVAIGGLGFLLFWPAMFAMDTKNADGNEGNALIDRNERLIRLARTQDCETTDWPSLPNKYS